MALLKTVHRIWASTQGVHVKNKWNAREALPYVHLDVRIKASTLMETLVATVLIVIVFMVSSMILNSFMLNKARANTELAEERMHALEYQYRNKGIALPYYEDFESWEISMYSERIGATAVVAIAAENPKTKAVVSSYIANED